MIEDSEAKIKMSKSLGKKFEGVSDGYLKNAGFDLKERVKRIFITKKQLQKFLFIFRERIEKKEEEMKIKRRRRSEERTPQRT